MRFQRTCLVGALVITGILTGCSEPEQIPASSQQETKWIDDTTADGGTTSDAIVKRIKVDAFPQEADSFEEGVRRHLKFQFRDGTSAHLTANDLWSSAVVGDRAYVTLQYPKSAKRLAILTYQRQAKSWILKSGLYEDIKPIKITSAANGLKLPFSTFQSIGSSSISSEDSSRMWLFHTKTDAVVITVLPKQDVPSSDWKASTLADGRTAYVQQKKQGTNLYYVDDDQLVLVTGNLSLSQLQQLAVTIAPVSSDGFPYPT